MRMTIRKKLLGGFLLLIIVTLTIRFGIQRIDVYSDRMADKVIELLNMDSEKGMATLDLVQWVDDLRGYLFGDKPFKGEIDPAKCVFEKWHSGFKSDIPEIMKIHAAMGERHEKIHEAAEKALGLYKKQDKAGAEKIFEDEIEPLSSEIVNLGEEMCKIWDPEIEKLKAESEKAEKLEAQVVIFGYFLTLGLGLLIAILLTRNFTRPIKLLTNTATTIAKTKDLSQGIQIKSNDEIGQLAEAFNNLIQSLREVINKISDATILITSASHQILAASQQQATGIAEEATQVSQVATSSRQLSVTAKQVTEHAHQIAEATKSTVSIAHSGNQAVEVVTGGMEKINQSALETAKKIEALGEKSQNIGEILTLIEDIAEQTNLLSLNASIEAARAGEAGRGFSVVADAIGKLAERTTKSTKDIAELIKDIQQDTSGCVLSMEQSTKETAQGNSLIREAGIKLKEIVSSFTQVAESAKEIALASQQQASGSEQISKAMMGVDQVMKESATSAKQSTESAQELNRLAEDLKKAVEQFKLGK